MSAYLLVSGDFVKTGGMDYANFALAEHLAESGGGVELVAHRVDESLSSRANVKVRLVKKPLNSYMLGGPLLAAAGKRHAAAFTRKHAEARIVANGGNCPTKDINWVHYVHHAYDPAVVGSLARRLRARFAHSRHRRDERNIIPRSRVVIANSLRTRRDLIDLVGVDAGLIRTVYYGVDADRFYPAGDDERLALRRTFGWDPEIPVVLFVGALGDRRKGFDTLFNAWTRLCADRAWDATLVVIGVGGEAGEWQRRAAEAGLGGRIAFLGFRSDVPDLMRAANALVHPARYEAYGLGVQEALCCGLPVVVSNDAGVAERYPTDLSDLLLPDPNDADDLARRLSRWRESMEEFRHRVAPFSAALRQHSWAKMADEIISHVESATPHHHQSKPPAYQDV